MDTKIYSTPKINKKAVSFFLVIALLFGWSVQPDQAYATEGDIEIHTTNGSTTYIVETTGIAIDPTLTISASAMDTTTIGGAKVYISSGYNSANDVLTYTAIGTTITAVYATSSGILQLTGAATLREYQTALRSVKYFNTSNGALGTTKAAVFSIEDSSMYSFNDHYYQIVDTSPSSITWKNAKASAEALTLNSMQGYLVTITSQEENDFIDEKVNADAWIGASDDYQVLSSAGISVGGVKYQDQTSSEGIWYWVTGPDTGKQLTQLSNGAVVTISGIYQNWNGGEPNNGTHTVTVSGVYGTYNEHYGQMVAAGGWNDLIIDPSSHNLPVHYYIVEYSGATNNKIATKTIELKPNTAPSVGSIGINGTLRVGSTLTGTYQYSDDIDQEGVSTYQWYRSDTANGASKSAITNATTTTYALTSEDLGKYISFAVTPVAVSGVIQGQTTESALKGPVDSAYTGGGSSGNSPAPAPAPAPLINPANGEVNGQSAIENTRTENKDGGTQSIVNLDNNKMNTLVNQMDKGSTLVLPVPGANTTGADSTQVRMNMGQMDQLSQQDVTLKIDNGQVQYALPPKAIDKGNLETAFGKDVNPANIELDITISDASEKMATVVQNAASKDSFSILMPPVEFNVTATYNGQTVNITKFSQHVTRLIALPESIDPRTVSTAIVVKEDGTTYHVPTNVMQVDGKWFAKVSSLTNSVYTLIHNEASFSDTKGEWFEKAVAEAASRTILDGYVDGTFQGANSITRAEFATMLINMLGLDKIGTSNYPDVKESDWFYQAVSRANEYKLVTGRLNGTFDPSAHITRQEAMIMMQRAAGICGLTAKGTDLTGEYKDSQKVSTWAKDAVKFNLENGLITGSDGELKPRTNITRAEASIVILRLLQKAELIDIRTQL